MTSGQMAASQTAGTIRRLSLKRLLVSSAVVAGTLATSAAAQTAEFSATPIVFPATGFSNPAVQTVSITVNTATAISSLVIPIGFITSPDFTVGAYSGCVIDGATVNPAGTICSVTIAFNQQGPGLRTGSLIITDAAGKATAFGIAGMGYGYRLAITPSSARVAAGLGPTAFGYTGDGASSVLAAVNSPQGIAADSFGNVFFADSGNGVVRMLDAFGNVTTVAGGGTLNPKVSNGGPATAAQLLGPTWLAVDAAGNLYISESGRNLVRKVAMSTDQTISTYAGTNSTGSLGDGPPLTIAMSNPQGLAFDAAGNLYIADQGRQRIRKVSADDTMMTVVAGSGTQGHTIASTAALNAQFDNPLALALDLAGNVYISDQGNAAVRELTTGGQVIPFAGTGTYGNTGDGGLATAATLKSPAGLAVDVAGDVYIVDSDAGIVRKVEASTGNISTVMGTAKDAGSYTAGVSVSTNTRMNQPTGVAFDTLNNLYLADTGNNVVRLMPPVPGLLDFAAQTAGNSSAPAAVTVANTGNISATIAAVNAAGSTATNFVLNNGGNGNCLGDLAPGAHCGMTIAFAPQASGYQSGEFDLLDYPTGNFVTSTQPIYLSGGIRVPITISPGTLASPLTGTKYKATITVAGGYGTVTVQTSGTLPAGITASISGTTVTLAGTSTSTSGTFIFTVYASDVLGETVAQAYTFTPGPKVLLYALKETITVSDPYVPLSGVLYTLLESITVSDKEDNLPGILYPVAETITVSDNDQPGAGVPLSLSPGAGALKNGVVGSTYLLNVAAHGGIGAVTVTVTGAVPGLSFSTANGVVSISGTPTATGDYLITVTATDSLKDQVSVRYGIHVSETSQTITAPSIANHTYGDATFSVSATSSSGLPVAIAVAGPATLTNGVLDMTGGGTVTLTFTQSGNGTYNAALPVTRTFLIAPAASTITPINMSRAFEAANPAFTFTASGLVHGDTAATLGGTPTLTTTAVLNSAAGPYPITASQGTLPSANYTFSFGTGVLTVTGHSPQTITFAQPPNVPLTLGSITLTARSTSGLAIVYNVSGPATISGSRLTLTGKGAVTVTATQPGNATFDPAANVVRTFTVQ